jgi:hypothetical protein
MSITAFIKACRYSGKWLYWTVATKVVFNFFFCASSSYQHKALLQAYLASDDAFKKLLENLLVGLTGDFTELLLLFPSYKSVF